MNNFFERYVEPPETTVVEAHEFLESLNNMSISHKGVHPLQEARCDAIVFENALRLGGLFCLFCGDGPMPLSCPCSQQQQDDDPTLSIPRWRLVHVHPCVLHNHCCPRGICIGRCPDCGGCNMDNCTHRNPSGGPIHPSPNNSSSIPPCPRTSGDRCYRSYEPPVIEEDVEMGDHFSLVHTGNERTALILMGGIHDEETHETESAGLDDKPGLADDVPVKPRKRKKVKSTKVVKKNKKNSNRKKQTKK